MKDYHKPNCKLFENLRKGDLMAKKDSMQKEVSKSEKAEEVDVGVQMDLIDVLPKKAKPIIAVARVLKRLQISRASAQEKENKQKAILLNLIEEANIQRLPDGKIKFHYDGITLTVTPKQESVSIKEDE